MNRKGTLFAAVLLLWAAPARTGEPGTAGANFLQIGAGPRGVAMGEAQTAVANDVYSTYWNPAGLGQLSYPEVALMHNQMEQGITQQYAVYARPLGPGQAVAGSLTRLSVGSVSSYDASGGYRGSVDAGDLALGVSYGRLLGLTSARAPEVRLGASGRWIQERLAATSASTFGADVGLLVGRLDNAFGDKARGLSVGLAVRNIGPGLKFHKETTPLPRTLSAGLAWSGRPWGDPMTVAFDLKSPADDDLSASIGLEYWVHRVLALRAGYISGQSEGIGLRLGMGIRLKRVLVEYSMASFGVLGDMHRFGFSYRFGGAPDLMERTAQDFITSGRNYIAQKRYYEAVVEFNRALAIDPGNRSALELINQALAGMAKPAAPAEEKKDASR